MPKDSLLALQKYFDICVVGELDLGKSLLVFRYVQGLYVEGFDPTVEELYTKVIRSGTSHNEVSILDTTSLQDHYATSRKRQVLNTGSMLFVYAINDRESFEVLEDIYYRLRNIRADFPPLVVAGLKLDREDERQILYEEGQALATRLGAISFLEASSKDNIGVSAVFEPLVAHTLLSRQAQSHDSRTGSSAISLRDVLSESESRVDLPSTPQELDLVIPPLEQLLLPEKEALAANPTVALSDAFVDVRPSNDDTVTSEHPVKDALVRADKVAAQKDHAHARGAAVRTSHARARGAVARSDSGADARGAGAAKSGCCVVV